MTGSAALELAVGFNLGHDFVWVSIAAFSVAILLLSLFDIPLPRGDIVGVGGTLDAVALVVLGPFAALISCVVGVLGALVFRKTARGVSDVVPAIVPRLAGLGVATVVYALLPEAPGGRWLPGIVGVSSYLAAELIVAQVLTANRTRRSVTRLVRGNLHRLAPVLLAQLSTALLAVAVYDDMREWSLLLVVALLMLIRQSYSLLLDIGETYRTTVEVLVQAAEGIGSERHGHAERTAQIAREIAMGCGLSPQQVERVSYAALLHDIDALSYGGDSPSGRPTSSSVLEDVPFFENVIDILRICDGIRCDDAAAHELDLLAAFIVALSSDVDAATHTHAHAGDPQDAVDRVAPLVPSDLKARAVWAAIQLGYGVPAVA